MKAIIPLFIGLILSSTFIRAQSITYDLKIEANQLMNMGRYGEAIDLLNRFISFNPQNVEGYLLRGTCFEKRGDFESAVSDYRTAKKIAPSNSQINSALNSVVETWYKLLFNKIEGYKREIAIHPDRAINYLEIGRAYKNLGEWIESESWYDEYLKRAEPSADDILRYTEVLAKNNRLTKGEQILKIHLDKNSSDHRMWSRYGYFLYWLGKYRLASEAFEKALTIRPFFKEALDGLDLTKGKGYVYTINDTTAKYQYGLPHGKFQYMIDKLYRDIKRNPEDDNQRFKLIDELVKAKRFEEAVEQLEILSGKYADSEEFENLYKKVVEYRKTYYAGKIDEYHLRLSADPNDTSAIRNLAKYYSYQGKYEQAKLMYERYLNINKDGILIRYQYAQLLAWNDELCLAKQQSEILLGIKPDKPEFQLLSANINLWLNENPEITENLFNKVLISNPDSKEALFGLAYLSLRNNKTTDAEVYLDMLLSKENVPEKEIEQLKNDIELNKIRVKEEELFSYLVSARKSAYESDCYKAVKGFEKYFEMGGTENQVYYELANTYQCINRYDKAISTYDNLISLGYDDYETIKQRAKVIFWSGDSLTSLREFRKLNYQNPDDAEVKLYLGDNYFALKQFQSARNIYSEMLEAAPESYIVKQRMKWLGSEGVESFSFESFPTYVLLSPQGNHFSDNTDFKYSLFGSGLEIGTTNFLSLGLSAYRGTLLSEFNDLNFNNIKGSVFLKFNESVKSSVTFGQTYFVNNIKENILETSLLVEKKDVYSLNLFYNQMDAAFILYSPFLVANRLFANHTGLRGDYNFNSGLVISGNYSFINVSDDNNGSNFQFRIGKEFQDEIKAGYEYYYYTFSENTGLYWSPENFEAHSLWADFNLIKDSKTEFSLGGKLGIIPENDFLLREFYARFSYKFVANFNIQAAITTGSSSRSGTGYNSTSFQLGAFWSPKF